MYYLAYGSNMNKKWMDNLCPTAHCIGSSQLKGYRLFFKGQVNRSYATIEYTGDTSCFVPVMLWEINEQDEVALDKYEDYPNFYRKEIVNIEVEGQLYKAMVYIMNEQPLGIPSQRYYDMLDVAYRDAQFDTTLLKEALYHSQQANKGEKNDIL